MDWAERYRPEHLTDILGNGAAVKQMQEWARNWTPDSHPLLIAGKPGVGKTSAAYALARDMHWEVLELNASDARTKSVIERIAGNSAVTASLFGADKKLIIIDEADNLEGNADRGGARAIADILREAQQPIILIANDAYGVVDSIRKFCDPVPFRAIAASTLEKRMRVISALEHISCQNDAIAVIAESAGGDLRSAVNMLFGSAAGKTALAAEDIRVSQKDERASIFDLVAGIYAGVPDARIQKLSRECEEKPDTVMQWIEESAVAVADAGRRENTYASLSRADIYLGRTMRCQYYTLWRYATALMTLGVAKEFAEAGFRPRIMPPSRWKRMGTAKKQKAVRRTLAAKFGEGYSIPDAHIQMVYLDLLSRFATDAPLAFCERYDLDAEQLTILLHDKTAATAVFNEVQKIAKGRETKRKKISATKQAVVCTHEESRMADLEKFPAKNPLQSLFPVSVPVLEPLSKAEEAQSEEKKKVPSQSTLDFF
ncbi:MAG: replication factor C large subunit [Methanocalculaceae archaeon]|jgi:replication factor C large subunit|nr:replication factor C large subunit [Methanocalculaceae archaeon]